MSYVPTEPVAAAFVAHAAEDFPREACGVVVRARGEERYARCRNLAEGLDRFHVCPEDYAAAEASGEVVAVVHSHAGRPPTPSVADRVQMARWMLPWVIVNWPTGRWEVHEPGGATRPPLVGRPFSLGTLDCFALVRDYYAETLGVELPEFPHHDEWWKTGESRYVALFPAAGFSAVSGPPRLHDVLLIQNGADVPNHGAVYLGGEVILHHLPRRLSRREGYRGYWQRNTTHVLRHRSQLP